VQCRHQRDSDSRNECHAHRGADAAGSWPEFLSHQLLQPGRFRVESPQRRCNPPSRAKSREEPNPDCCLFHVALGSSLPLSRSCGRTGAGRDPRREF
jgi:hypothetical protein